MQESKGRFCFDIEATGLLDDSTVDYTASPWKLRDNFKVHCIIIEDIDTQEVFKFVQDECYNKFPAFVQERVNTIVGHNIINYDLMVCKVALGIDYSIGPDSWGGKPVEIIDTYVLSKVLNPDRRGHSLDFFGTLLGEPKIDWRAKAIELGLIDGASHKGAEFAVYHPEMLVYNRQDVKVNIQTYHLLMKEWGDWKWDQAFELEQQVAEIVTRQSHRGFWFDVDLAQNNVRELDKLMEEKRAAVEPHLPAKPMGKTKLSEYVPSKNQFKKDGEPSANIIKWVAKHGGTITESEDGKYVTELYGKAYKLPIKCEPIVTTEPASIEDTTFIKGILVDMGWSPSQYKERDLTVDTKKQKLTQEKFLATIERYIEQTLSSPFKLDRCEKLSCSPNGLREKLLKHDLKKPLKVYTNPTFTVGQEKELDPNLERLYEKFPYVQDIVEFLTYRHRRNSILGGGYDPDEDDEEDFEKGFLANVRSDGRIATPADTCGCATGRMKHRVVANVPRVSSLYGEPMRSLFGVDRGDKVQLAYDFASLEGRIESHYCWKYDDTKEYCNSLIQEKPHDVHTLTAKKISELISQAFSRQSAKSVKYACVPMDTQILTRSGWKTYYDLEVGEEVLGYDKETDTKKWTKVLGKIKQRDEVVEFGNNWFKVRATKDHKWFVKQRREFSTGKPNFSVRKAVLELRTTEDLNSESNIIVNAPFDTSFDVLNSEDKIAPMKYGFDWSSRVLRMSHAERLSFLEGFMIADGYYNGKWQWSQNHGDICEAALLASYLVHDGVVCVSERMDTKSPMKTVILTNKRHRTMQRNSVESLGEMDVWCVETELGSWVMRQGNTITITGNCSYGAQGPRIAKTIGCILDIGVKVFDAFWQAAKPLAELKEAVTQYWKTTGRKEFIPGIDGRKIRTRSEHALLNSLFQSAGVICAKKVMVLQDRKFKALGYGVDFWKDDWKNKEYVQQLIAYHDEAQLEASKSLVKWKKFEDEEQQKEFCKENTDWIPVHSDKGFFAGWTPITKAMLEAVDETNKHFRINVPLAIDPQIGFNWATCH